MRFIPDQCGHILRTKENNNRTKCDVKLVEREFIPEMQSEDDIASQITRGVSRYFRNLNNAVLTEMIFADGRRCDVITVDENGVISIVEVKSSVADFRSDGKWPEYRQWCDLFYFAVSTSFPRELIPEDCGLILADSYGADIFRDAPEDRLNAARRKALMLRFARVAAFRLQDKNDPDRFQVPIA